MNVPRKCVMTGTQGEHTLSVLSQQTPQQIMKLGLNLFEKQIALLDVCHEVPCGQI